MICTTVLHQFSYIIFNIDQFVTHANFLFLVTVLAVFLSFISYIFLSFMLRTTLSFKVPTNKNGVPFKTNLIVGKDVKKVI